MALRRPAAATTKPKDNATPDDVATFVVPDLSVKELLSCIPYVICLLQALTPAHIPQCPLLQEVRSQVLSLRASLFFHIIILSNLPYTPTESGILSFSLVSTLLPNLGRPVFIMSIIPTRLFTTSPITLYGPSIVMPLASWPPESGSLPTVRSISLAPATLSN